MLPAQEVSHSFSLMSPQCNHIRLQHLLNKGHDAIFFILVVIDFDGAIVNGIFFYEFFHLLAYRAVVDVKLAGVFIFTTFRCASKVLLKVFQLSHEVIVGMLKIKKQIRSSRLAPDSHLS